MKTYHFLAAFLLIMFLSINFTLAQNEIEKYNLPKLIEGSNLLISASPYYSNTVYNDTTKRNFLNINMGLDFSKWRFTPKLNYAADIQVRYSTSREGVQDVFDDTVYKYSQGRVSLDGGLSYYPFKNPVYTGFYCASLAVFKSSSKPASNNNLYAFTGFGKFVNAGQVTYAKNFEKVLLNEGVIKKIFRTQFSKN